MAARDVVIEAALSYRMNVVLVAEGREIPSGFRVGPAGGAGIRYSDNSLAVEPTARPDDILHELAHLVVGRPSTWLSEGFVLMPFEWELAKHLSRRMGQERAGFMKGVKAYQDCTEIGRFQMSMEEFGPNVRRMKWWRRGVERAKRLGLLYTDGTPTFLCAQWKGSGVPQRARGWDPGYDPLFP
jgi:hypothetical protein